MPALRTVLTFFYNGHQWFTSCCVSVADRSPTRGDRQNDWAFTKIDLSNELIRGSSEVARLLQTEVPQRASAEAELAIRFRVGPLSYPKGFHGGADRSELIICRCFSQEGDM